MYSELLNSTSATEAHLILQTNTPYLGSTQRPVSSSAFYLSTARVLKEGEINKPDLVTYIILFFFLLLTVTLIVLFINCQLKNSFFATLPYDRSLREARSPWRTQAVWHEGGNGVFQQQQGAAALRDTAFSSAWQRVGSTLLKIRGCAAGKGCWKSRRMQMGMAVNKMLYDELKRARFGKLIPAKRKLPPDSRLSAICMQMSSPTHSVPIEGHLH